MKHSEPYLVPSSLAGVALPACLTGLHGDPVPRLEVLHLCTDYET